VETPIEIELILALILLISAIGSFALEKVRMEITALSLLAFILLLGLFGMEKWPSWNEILRIFLSEAPLAIIGMFMVSCALSKQGIIEKLTLYLQELTKCGYHPFLFILLLLVAGLSAFINNTPVVVILLPVVIGISSKLGVPASKLLIPVSYASIFGGCCTLIGTSTNILASGFMSSSSLYPDMQAMGMFELTKIGMPLMILGILFVILFGKKLLPEREALSKILSEIHRKEFVTEAIITEDSTLVGQIVKDSKISTIAGVRLLDVVRNGKSLPSPISTLKLRPNDRLILSCKAQGIIEAREVQGFKLFEQAELGIQQINTSEAVMVETMIKPNSSFSSQRLSEADFRGRFNLTVVALHRRGKNLGLRLDNLKLEPGDTLLILGSESSVEKLRAVNETVLLDKVPLHEEKKLFATSITIGVLIAIIFLASTGMVSLFLIALVGAGLLVLCNSMTVKDALRSVEWNLLLLIYSMLALGVVMEKSGAASMLAQVIKDICESGINDKWQIIGALAILYLCTALLTELLSNNATISIMTPVSLLVAFQFGLNTDEARAFVLTCCIAASASFMTPIGYQTNTFVYTVGGYRFKDFLKFGFWPMLIYLIGTITLVGIYYNFFPS
jgi:di/tricarboxylate transporter